MIRGWVLTIPWSNGSSFFTKSNHSCVAMPKLIAVYALSCAICTLKSGAPSIRLKALSVPSPSTIAMHIGRSISRALASAPAIIRWAASTVILDFWKVFSAIEISLSFFENVKRLHRPQCNSYNYHIRIDIATTQAIRVYLAGALVDRWDRRHVMIFCDTGQAILCTREHSDTTDTSDTNDTNDTSVTSVTSVTDTAGE